MKDFTRYTGLKIPQGTKEVTIPGTIAVVTTTEEVEEEITEPVSVSVSVPVVVSISASFTRTLRVGMTGEDVKRLQQLLNSDPDLQLTSSGIGSLGNETEYFGPMTRSAIQKFQVKYGIVSSGDEQTTGYGLIGPKTRTKLQEVFE